MKISISRLPEAGPFSIQQITMLSSVTISKGLFKPRLTCASISRPTPPHLRKQIVAARPLYGTPLKFTTLCMPCYISMTSVSFYCSPHDDSSENGR